jgi:predicted transcriptional regulator
LSGAKLKATNKSFALHENLLMSIRNLPTKNSRRDDILIFSHMLSCAIEGVGITELMSRAGLSHGQLDKYIPKLLKSELLETYLEKERLRYRTTNKGKIFLKTSSALYKLMS